MFNSVPSKTLFRGNGDLDLAPEARIVEPVGVANAFVRYQLKVGAGKGMVLARAEIGKRHLEGAAYLRVRVVHLTSKAIRWKPLRFGVASRNAL